MPILPLEEPGSDDDHRPCTDWCTWVDVVACRPELVDVEVDAQAQALAAASATLYKRTMRRYPGVCQRTVAVCDGGACCGSWGPCGCWPAGRVELAPRPVRSIDEVVLEGVVLDEADYRLSGARWLDRVAGTWPGGSATDTDAFRVTFTYGRGPGADGVLAAAALAGELAASCVPGLVCKLPRRMRSMNREDGQYTLVGDDLERLMQGLFGLPEIDNFIVSESIDRKASSRMIDPLRHGGLSRLA